MTVNPRKLGRVQKLELDHNQSIDMGYTTEVSKRGNKQPLEYVRTESRIKQDKQIEELERQLADIESLKSGPTLKEEALKETAKFVKYDEPPKVIPVQSSKESTLFVRAKQGTSDE